MRNYLLVANRMLDSVLFPLCFPTQHNPSRRLSELLYLPLPTLPTASQKSDSILIGTGSSQTNDEIDDTYVVGGKWEDEEERKFFEDVQDLQDFVPSSVLGVDDMGDPATDQEKKETEKERIDKEKEEVKKLEAELERLCDGAVEQAMPNGDDHNLGVDQDE
jgi:regulator of nonsense transcripts 2